VRVLKKPPGIKSTDKKADKLKRIWPKGYKRFSSESEEEFEIRPQKYNPKLIILSLLILLILWFFFIGPYLSQVPKKEGPIKIKLFKSNIPLQGNPTQK